MHNPSLKDFVGYQQAPSLGVQGARSPPGEDIGVQDLPVLLPTTCRTHSGEQVSRETKHTAEVLVHMCCTL